MDFPAFRPRRWLGNAHAQTIVGNFLRRVDRLPAAVTELVAVPLPPEMRGMAGAEALDRVLPSRVLCHCHWRGAMAGGAVANDAKRADGAWAAGADDAGALDGVTVVLVHGLEGSSGSGYIVGNAGRLWAAGASVVRMNMRNCGGTEALSPSLYHSGLSSDVVAVLRWLMARGAKQVVLAGYSMGGNLVLKAAGELGREAPRELVGVVGVSPPMDLRESADALHAGANRVYERRFLRALAARYRRKVQMFPAVFAAGRLEGVRSIREFDERVMSPYCGFSGADDYYARAGAARVVGRIAVPTLVVHALDDPFIRLTGATRAALRANPCVQLVEPAHGGHCAFLEDARPGYDGRWAEARLLEFVRECAAPAGAGSGGDAGGDPGGDLGRDPGRDPGGDPGRGGPC